MEKSKTAVKPGKSPKAEKMASANNLAKKTIHKKREEQEKESNPELQNMLADKGISVEREDAILAPTDAEIKKNKVANRKKGQLEKPINEQEWRSITLIKGLFIAADYDSSEIIEDKVFGRNDKPTRTKQIHGDLKDAFDAFIPHVIEIVGLTGLSNESIRKAIFEDLKTENEVTELIEQSNKVLSMKIRIKKIEFQGEKGVCIHYVHEQLEQETNHKTAMIYYDRNDYHGKTEIASLVANLINETRMYLFAKKQFITPQTEMELR